MIEKTSVQTGQDLPHRPFSPPEPLANGSSVAMRQVLGEKKRGDAPCGEERGRKAFIEDEFVNAEEDEQFPLRETLSTSSLVWSFFYPSLCHHRSSRYVFSLQGNENERAKQQRERVIESGAKPTTGKRPSSLSQLRLRNTSFLSLFNPSLPLSLALFLDLVDICLGFQSRKETLVRKRRDSPGIEKKGRRQIRARKKNFLFGEGQHLATTAAGVAAVCLFYGFGKKEGSKRAESAVVQFARSFSVFFPSVLPPLLPSPPISTHLHHSLL